MSKEKTSAGPQAQRSDQSRLSEFFRYHGFWAPGVRLFRAIGFRAKALIIAVTFAVPIGALAWSYFGDKAEAIGFSEKERLGVVYAREVMPLLKLLLRQRLVAVQAAQGATAADAAEIATAVQAQQARLAQAEKANGEALGTAKAYAQFVEAGRKLPPAGAGVDAVFDGQGAQIQALLDLLGASTDGSNLTLDPDIDTYYLMDTSMARLPAMLDAAGQLRSLGAVVLAGGGSSQAARVRRVTEQAVITSVNLAALQADLEKAVAYNKELKALLQDDAPRQALADFGKLVEATVLNADGPKGDAAAHLAAGTKAVDAMLELTQRATDQLDRLIAERVARLSASRDLTTGVLLASLLVVLYLFISFRKVLDGGLREVAFHIDAMAQGDLTTRPRAWGADEAAALMHTLRRMQDELRRIVVQVRGASDSIVHSSAEIAHGAQDLSARTEHSAANLQQSASAMEEISATVRETAGVARDATRLAQENTKAAERGGRIIGSMVQTMEGIRGSSSRIGEIIATIDGIAFQTNILALNAAVEAARAGESGRGFAVVASEVRSLAQRSAAAAREIKTLISASVEQVEAGVAVVREAGGAIDEIVERTNSVGGVLGQIASGAAEQAQGVTQTSKSVHELDAATQQNAALVEQTAAAAASLKDQAVALAAEVAQFKLPAAA